MVTVTERSTHLKIILFVAIWWISNIISTISSKKALTSANINEPKNNWMELTAMQSGAGGLLAWFWSRWVLKQTFNIFRLSPSADKSMIFASVVNLIGNSATNIAFSMIASSSVQVVKSTEPVFTFLFATFLAKSKTDGNFLIFLSILVISMGSSLFLKGDSTYNLFGLIAAVASNIAFSLRNISLKNEEAKEPLQKYIIMSLFSFIMISPVLLVNTIFNLNSFYLGKDSLMSVVFHFSYNLASINVLQNVSPITHAVLNLCKRAVVVAFNIIHFSISLSIKMKIGLVVLLCGLILFAYFNHQKKTQKKYSNIPRKHSIIMALTMLAFCSYMVTLFMGGHVHVTSHVAKGFNRYFTDEIINETITGNTGSKNMFTSWLYDHHIPESFVNNVKAAVLKRNDLATMNIYCGSTNCMQAFADVNSDKVNVTFFRLNEVIKDTPFYEWMKRLPLIKILSASNFEHLLTCVVRLSLLWKDGGLYINPKYEYHNFTFERVVDGAWIVIADDVQFLDISFFPMHSDFVWKLSEYIVDKFPLDHVPSEWPINFNCDDVSRNFYQKHYNAHSCVKTSIDEIVVKLTQSASPIRTNHYATISYESRGKQGANIGDEVQGFTGMQFLPFIDTFIDRQILKAPEHYTPHSTTMFFNAWWGNTRFNWPPSKKIVPQFISMHTQEFLWKKMLRDVEYLREMSPIGTRDMSTLNWLRKNQVESYLSGCMTLFLKNRYEPKDRKDVILVVDVKDRYMNLLPANTEYSFVIHDKYPIRFKRNLLFASAYERIDMYSRAKLVITQRIHAALPCVALGTPVIFINSAGMPGAGGSATKPSIRTSGLTDLFHTVDMYKMNRSQASLWFRRFNWNNPPPNPGNHKLMRLRATQWNFFSQKQEFYDSAMKFGLVPPTMVKQTIKPTAKVDFYLILDDSVGMKKDNKKLKWNYMRVIEALLYHHEFATITIFSEFIEQSNFNVLTDVGFNITAKKHNLKDMIYESRIDVLNSFDSSTCEHLPLLKLLILYNHGGIFVEENVIITEPLLTLPINVLDEQKESVSFMKFEKHHELLRSLVEEYVRTYKQDCVKVISSLLITPHLEKHKELSASLINRMSRDNITTCLNEPYNQSVGTYGVQFDFNELDNEINGKKMKFGTKCKYIFNEFCLLCNYQY